jgi:hypothetical protein
MAARPLPRQLTLRPGDVAVALQLALTPELPYRELAAATGVSLGEVHNAVRRLEAARLARAGTRTAAAATLLEFLVHGVPHAFPGIVGAETRGVPTAHAAPPLAARMAPADPLVWPDPHGRVRGLALTPLYAGAPSRAAENPPLYELLALVDALRVGRARERRLAQDVLRERLLSERARPKGTADVE